MTDPIPVPSARPQKLLRIVTLAAIPLAVVLVVLTLRSEFGPRFEPFVAAEAPTAAFERATTALPDALLHPVELVRDEATGWRPRADQEVVLANGERARTTGFGIWRDAPLTDRPLEGPRILWVGDELVCGAVSRDATAPAHVERGLRTRAARHPGEELDGAVVIDAACPGYSLFQLARRIESLVPAFDPHLVVAVVHGGNDLVELIDESRPHIDRRGFATAALDDPPTTLFANLRAKLGALRPGTFANEFYQAAWLHLQTQRAEDLDVRLRTALTELRGSFAGPILLVYVPPTALLTDADLLAASTEPDGPNDFARAVAASEAQAVWAGRTLSYLRLAGLSWLDAGPTLAATADGHSDAFLPDTRLSAEGHVKLAETLLPRIVQILDASY